VGVAVNRYSAKRLKRLIRVRASLGLGFRSGPDAIQRARSLRYVTRNVDLLEIRCNGRMFAHTNQELLVLLYETSAIQPNEELWWRIQELRGVAE
jgi:hypothetical protein